MRILAAVLALLPAIDLAGKPGWQNEGGAKYYYSANSLPTYRPPVVRYQPPPPVPVRNPNRGGITYVQNLPIRNVRGAGGYVTMSGGSFPALSGAGSRYGGVFCPPSGQIVVNPFCK